MRWLGQAFGILLIVLILVVTPIAFWAFNIDRVTMNPQTYLTALKSQHFYDNLLPGLVDAAAFDKSGDPTIRAVSTALMENMTPDDWTVLSDKLMPPAVIQQELTNNINRFFEWIGGSGTTPDIQFSLQTLKSRLTGNDARSAAQIVVPKLPACTASQEQVLTSSDLSNNPDKDALCNPESAASRKNAVDNLTTLFNTLGKNLPDTWKLSSVVSKYAPNAPNNGLSEIGLVHFRATLWLGNQLVVLLFLIPVALFALIIIVTVRSAKELFRWLGWVLILSGLITSIPVPFLSSVLLTLSPAMQNNIQRGAGPSGRILASLVGGMIGSIFSGLTLAVLIQAGIVIVIGFICVFVSVLLPASAPDVTPEEVALERMQLAMDGPNSGSGSTPSWLPATPSFMPRSAPAAAPPSPSTPPQNVLLPPDAPTYMPPPGSSNPPPAESSGNIARE